MVISSHSQDPIIQLGENINGLVYQTSWSFVNIKIVKLPSMCLNFQVPMGIGTYWMNHPLRNVEEASLVEFIYSTQFINLYPHLLLGVYLHAQFSQLLSQAMHQLMTCILIFKYLLEFTLMEQSHLPQSLRACSFEDARLYSYYWSYVSRPLYLETI